MTAKKPPEPLGDLSFFTADAIDNEPFFSASTPAADDLFPPATAAIAWGKKVSPEFKAKVLSIASELDFDANFLMAAMAFESGETFSAAIQNAAGSGAVGLIQFMPTTAAALGTSCQQLECMSAEAQLDYVAKYFVAYKGKLRNVADVYMVILWPAGVGKPDDYVLFDKADAQHPKRYMQNRGLDLDKEGKITKAEAAAMVAAKLEKGMRPEYIG